MFAARLLSVTDDADRSGQAAMVRAFTLFLLAHLVVRTMQWTLRGGDWLAGRWLMTALLAGCAAVAWRRPERARAAAALALLLLCVKLAASFPTTSNHFFIELLCLGLIALCDPGDADERALLLSAARWLTVIVFFYSGLQKVLYATYFDAQFLGVSIGHKPALAWLFGWIVPAAELNRLRDLHPLVPGQGPFDIRSPGALALANGVYLFEMGAPVLLLWRRTRPYAAVAALAVIGAIEIGARELLFGILFVNLLLLFFARPVNRALLPASLAALAVLAAARVGLLPSFSFN
ncbi:hypothetical protein KF840_04660 [bacterium]|nr:hypothetical protein [bacterium]